MDWLMLARLGERAQAFRDYHTQRTSSWDLPVIAGVLLALGGIALLLRYAWKKAA